MDNYFELIIDINPDISDLVSDICFTNFDCEGVILAEESYKDLEMISSTEGKLKAFLSLKLDCSYVEKILTENRKLLLERGFANEELGSWNFVIVEKENQDWSKKWKEKWGITHVSDRITIVPSWIAYTPAGTDEIILTLDPGCAFGTGTHSTTKLCMLAIEKYFNGGDLADIGTGSGILAILGKKFGASYVYGCDNDETVIDVAKENALKNNTLCEFELNTADKLNREFDFVCANILHNILAEIMGNLKAIMKPGGMMVLSGILNDKKHIVIDAVEKYSLKLIEETHMNQWTAFIVQKN